MFSPISFSLNLATALLFTFAPAWDEPQPFGFFSGASIAGNLDSVWVVGGSRGMRYPAFLFTGNSWQSIDRDQIAQHFAESVIQRLEGGVEVVLQNGRRYSLHPENGRIHIRIPPERHRPYYEGSTYSLSDSIAGLIHVHVMSIDDEQMLIEAVVNLWQLNDSTKSHYRGQLYSTNSAQEEFSAQIVVFDMLNRLWHYYPSPPIKADLTCGAMTDTQIWLGSAHFSEMGTAHGGAGVAVFDLAEQRYTMFTSRNSELLDEGILALRRFNDDLWVVSISGIQMHNLASQKWTHFRINPEVELRKSAAVVLIANGEPVEHLNAGARVQPGSTFTGMVSVPLQNPIVGWAKVNSRIKRSMHQENGVWKAALGDNETIHTERSTASQPISVFGGAETGTEVEIIEQSDEWLRVKIVQGWIPADAILPQVVEVDGGK